MEELKHSEKLSIRVCPALLKQALIILEKYPNDFNTLSDIFRAGVYALARFKEQK